MQLSAPQAHTTSKDLLRKCSKRRELAFKKKKARKRNGGRGGCASEG